MTKSENAIEKFNGGFNCAQSVFSVFAEENKIDEKLALKISTVFGGGIAHMDYLCGAVTGDLMVISLKYGRASLDDTEAKEITYNKAQEFVRIFKRKFESIECSQLIGVNLSTEEGLRKAKENKITKTLCPKYVKGAVEILENIL